MTLLIACLLIHVGGHAQYMVRAGDLALGYEVVP